MSEPVRILIVEDVPTDFELAQREIRKAVNDCVFQHVQTRQDFLRTLEAFQPDLILSDYHMPSFDGMSALQLAQEHAKLTPFIIWTGTMGEDVAVECMKAGAVNYILKENIKRLGPAVAHALEERRLLLEHKRAEEIIRNNEKRFRTLIENGRDNISLLAVDGTLLWESPATIRSLGYAQDEFVGHNIFDLIHPDDLKWAGELYAKMLQEPGSRQDGVFRLRHNDGSWRWNEATVTNMLNEPGVNAIVVNYRDITERKQAEDALRESQIKYENLVETSHDLIWSVDADGRITFLNRAAKEIYGYEPEELIGHSFFEILDPQYHDRDLKKFRETVAQADEFKELEIHVQHRDGRQIVLSSNSLVLHDADGNVVSITGSSHDITERKQAEEELHKSEERYRFLFENNPFPMWVYDLKTLAFLAVNDSAVGKYGYTREEFLHMTIADIRPLEEVSRLMEDVAKQRPTLQHAGEWRHRLKDGTIIEVEITSHTLRIDEHDAAIVVAHDITERKQAEERLEKERNLLRTLIDHLPDRIFAMDTQGRKTLSNTADWRASGGESMEEVLGKTDFDTYPPEMAQEFWALDKAVLDSGEPVINYEEPGLDSEGNPVWVLSTKVPLRDSDGKVAGLVGIGRDITDLKRAQMERQALLEIMQGLANMDDLQEFLKLIHHSIASVIYAQNFFVVFYNKDSRLFEEVYSVDQYDQPSPPSALEKSITSYVFRSGEPLLLTQALFDELVEQGEVELVGTDSESWLGAPLKTQSGTIGVIAVQHYEDPNRYTERDRDFLALIGSQVALAIERKQTEDRLRLSDQILQRVNALVLVADSQGSIVYVSPAARTILGYEPDELLGDNWWKVSRSETAATQREKEYVGLAARRETPISAEAYERAIQDRSGNIRWISWVDAPGLGNTLIGVGHDITERKQVEEALRQSENRYSLASKATNDVIWEWDQETNQLFWNENAQSIFGYPAEEIGMYETWWEDHIHADDRERVLSKLNALIAEDESLWKDEYRFLRRDGSYAFIIDRAYVERDATGRPLRVIGAMSDITEQKRTEDQLKYHARLLRHINDAVIATDEQSRITAWNRAAEKMYGWRSEEVIGRIVSEILSFDFTDEQRAEARELLNESNTSRSERIYHRRDGRTIYVEANTIALLDQQGRMTGYVSVHRDFTERKRAEESLRESEKRFRNLFENTPVSIWEEDFSAVKTYLDGLKDSGTPNLEIYLNDHPEVASNCVGLVNIIDVNQAALKMHGATDKGALLKDLEKTFLPESFDTFKQELMAIARGEHQMKIDVELQTLSGERRDATMIWAVAPGHEKTYARVLVSLIDITERKRAEEQTQLQLQRVRALRAIDIAISSSFDLNLTLNLLLDQVIAQLNTDAAVILLFHPSTRTLEHAASRGFRSTAIRQAKIRLGEGYAGKAVLERRTIHISNLVETNPELAYSLSLKTENFTEYYGVPFIVKGEVKGVLEIFHRSALAGDPEWLDFLETLAGQAAIAIDNATLFEDLQYSTRELFQAYDATIEGWSHALDLRDKETEGHTLRVTEMTLELARKFGFTDEELRYVRWGALLHDIGKMGVPDYILLKPDKLTDEEWERMRQHPVFALEMLSPIAYLKSSLDIPYCHHEKWDGTGYPRELKGDVIPLAARLFAVVDVWDALRSDRPYREGWSAEKTLEHIRSLSGTHFDPQVVEYFLEMIERPNSDL